MKTEPLTTAQLYDLMSVVSLLILMVSEKRPGPLTQIHAVREESREVIEAFWLMFKGRLPGIELSIEPHLTSGKHEVVVARRPVTESTK